MTRDELIRFIPKPSNNDVIIYDISLRDLADVDVYDEYIKTLPVFNFCRQQLQGYENNIKSYEETINKIYLFKSNWSEEDYLFHLQNEKKTYNTLYGPIKKLESNLDVLQKKIKMINDKIELQIAKEEKEIQDHRNNIDKRINENVDKLMTLKDLYSTLKLESERIEENLKENEEEFAELQIVIEGLSSGECKCRYCGNKVSNVSKNSNFYKRTYKYLEKNKENLEKLLEKKEKNQEKLKEYSESIKEIQQTLKNDSQFKSEKFNFYRKKSVEVLKLEGKRDAMLNDATLIEEEIKSNSEANSRPFIEMKNKIEKYELSLQNLEKIKKIKAQIEQQRTEYLKLRNEAKEMYYKLEQYKKYLSIYFKIYEQKASEFCGKSFKFKIFDFNELSLVEKFEIYYNGIEYKNLKPSLKKYVERVFEEKFLFYE